MSVDTMGDYQTPLRVTQKLQAIPIPEDLTGLSVLDVGCDHGAFCKIASDRGAARVLGLDRGRGVRNDEGAIEMVDLVARNRARKWPRCEFEYFNLGEAWTMFGRFDLVLCFSLYHHVYGETGDHDRIWRWLWAQTAGTLLWEGPVDTRDSMARQRAKKFGNYTRESIFAAASHFYEIEEIGPALHFPHRIVLRCTPKIFE